MQLKWRSLISFHFFTQRNPPQAVLAGGGHHERPVQQPNEAGQGCAVHADQWQPRRRTARNDDGPRHDSAPLEQHADAVAQLPAEPAATDAPTAAAPSAAPSLFTRALGGRFHRFRGRHGTGHDAAAAAGRPEPQLQTIEALANDRWTHSANFFFLLIYDPTSTRRSTRDEPTIMPRPDSWNTWSTRYTYSNSGRNLTDTHWVKNQSAWKKSSTFYTHKQNVTIMVLSFGFRFAFVC